MQGEISKVNMNIYEHTKKKISYRALGRGFYVVDEMLHVEIYSHLYVLYINSWTDSFDEHER